MESLFFSDIVSRWLEFKRLDVKEQSIAKYRLCIENHILPNLGTVQLASINAELIERFPSEKRVIGRLKSEGGLSAISIRGMSIILQSILDFAYDNTMGL